MTHLSTACIHADDIHNRVTDVAPPINVSTTFRYDNENLVPEVEIENFIETIEQTPVYSRESHPNSLRLQTVLSDILGGHATVYNSGVSAFHALIFHYNPKRFFMDDGYSGVREKFIRFRCVVTECRPTSQGEQLYSLLQEKGIPVIMVVDGAVGAVIDQVDKVFVGAEGVAESGGIINVVGTYSVGVLAQNARKPFYVVTECHKFVRMFPLSPDDLSMQGKSLDFTRKSDEEDQQEILRGPRLDYTAQEYITALITDLGVLTPSAVSEELIKMWYD